MSMDCSDQCIVDNGDNVSCIVSCGHVDQSVLKSWSSWNPLAQRPVFMEGIPLMTFGVVSIILTYKSVLHQQLHHKHVQSAMPLAPSAFAAFIFCSVSITRVGFSMISSFVSCFGVGLMPCTYIMSI